MQVGIFHTAFLGDLALTGLLVEALAVSGHSLTLFSHEIGLQLFRHDRRVHNLIRVKKEKGLRKLSSVRSIAKQIRQERLDVLLVPHRSLTSSLIARLSGVPVRVGYDSAVAASLAYTELRHRDLARHESLRCLDLAPDSLVDSRVRARLESLGHTILSNTPPPDFAQRADGLLPDAFFIVSPGSAWETKIYPPEQLFEAARMLLASESNLHCILTGGSQDLPSVERFLAAARGSEVEGRIRNAVGKLRIEDLPALFARAEFVIANDSAPVHIACGVGTPVVAVFGPTDPAWGYGPSGQRSRVVQYRDAFQEKLPCQPCAIHGSRTCPKGHFRCMRELPPNALAAAVSDVRGPHI